MDPIQLQFFERFDMWLWAVILLVIDMALMGGILYIVLFRKKVARPALPQAEAIDAAEIKNELKAVKRAASRLEARSEEFERLGAGLKERQAALEALLRKAGAAQRADGAHQADDEDVYAKAVRMLRSGVPESEIARSLGLLKGEAQLLTALNRM